MKAESEYAKLCVLHLMNDKKHFRPCMLRDLSNAAILRPLPSHCPLIAIIHLFNYSQVRIC